MKVVDIILNIKDRAKRPVSKLNKNIGKTRSMIQRVNRTTIRPKVSSKAKSEVSSLTKGIKNLVGAAAITAAVAGIVSIGKASAEAFDVQARADAQLRTTLESTRGAARVTFKELKKQAQELQGQTLFGDEATQNAQSLLLTFTNIKTEVFKNTVPVIQDIATVMGTDLKSATVQVGKALNDPAKNLSALARSGIQFSESQSANIKRLQETGQLAKAQTIILNELQTQFGGSAKAAAEAGLGPFKQFQNQVGDVQESFGKLIVKGLKPLLPFLTAITQGVDRFFTFIDTNSKQLRNVFAPLFDALDPVLEAFDGLIDRLGLAGEEGVSLEGVFNAIGTALEFISPLLELFGDIIATVVNSVVDIVVAIRDFIKGSERAQKVIGGLLKAAKEVFIGIRDSAKAILGGVGDLIVGVFTADLDKIKEGLGSIGTGVKEGNTVALGVKAFKGFKKGFDEGLETTDFFAKSNVDEEAESIGSGAGTPRAGFPGSGQPSAAVAKSRAKAEAGIGAVTGDTRAQRNITVTIGKIVGIENLNNKTIKEAAINAQDVVTNALLSAVRDFETTI